MAKTYTSDMLLPRNWLRSVLGDTQVSVDWTVQTYDGALFDDDEIDSLVDALGVSAAGASLAEAKASRYGALVGKMVDADASEDITAAIEHFRGLAERFRKGLLVPPSVDTPGGIAVTALALPDLSEYRTD
jgi:hypothetical protein